MLMVTGRKFLSMKLASWSLPYDSASSRTHAPQAGAALKSSNMGLFSAFARVKAVSGSLIHCTDIHFPP
jgi:hypothetical protein